MKNIWHEQNPKLLTELKEQLNTAYPSLHVFNERRAVYIRGNFPIHDVTKKKLIEEFKIEIKVPNNFPMDIPTVKEIGGKIPKIANRHFYPTTSKACLFMPEEKYLYFPKGTTIFDFIDGPIKDFFIGQASFILTGKWPFGERPHDDLGIVDYYHGILQTRDERVITRFIFYLSKKEVKGHWICYCGSGKIMKKCHFMTLIETRQKISPRDVKKSLFFMARKYFHHKTVDLLDMKIKSLCKKFLTSNYYRNNISS